MSNHPENNNATTPQEQVRNPPNLRYPLTEEDTPFPPLAAYPPLVPRPLAPRPHHPPPTAPNPQEINLDEALRRMHDPRLAALRNPTNPSWQREESIILARRDLRDREAQLQAIDDPSDDGSTGANPDPILEDMAEYQRIPSPYLQVAAAEGGQL